MKIIIYKPDVCVGGQLVFDTDDGSLAMECNIMANSKAVNLDDKIGGIYTAEEVLNAWLANKKLTGMSGKWQYDADHTERHEYIIRRWLEKEY